METPFTNNPQQKANEKGAIMFQEGYDKQDWLKGSSTTEADVSDLGQEYINAANKATEETLGSVALTPEQLLKLDRFATNGDPDQSEVDEFKEKLLRSK